MTTINRIKGISWLKILLFYSLILAGTFIARKLPNFLNTALQQVTDIPFSFNYNHGIVTLIMALLFYKFSNIKQEITLLGNNKLRSLLFPAVLFICYTSFGMHNNHGVNQHLWAFIFCCFAFVYNLMEEYAWRGYLIDSLHGMNYIAKSIISGVFWCFWHLLVFNNFDQYGGFWVFLAFCIIFSFILTFAVIRTKSIVAAAAIHAFIIQMNLAAILCFVLFMVLLITWNKRIKDTTALSEQQNI